MRETDGGQSVETPLGQDGARPERRWLNRSLERPVQRLVQRPLSLVCIGGGTGLPVVLRGLAKRALPTAKSPGLELTAVVAMSDDGGSSGRLRRMRGVLPPGDVRNCLVALSGTQSGVLQKLFQHRFEKGGGIGGHAVGNLLLAALTELRGDFMEAVELSARMLEARGRVLPSTLEAVELEAELWDRTLVRGERNIARSGQRVRRVSLKPELPRPSDGVIEAIRTADLVTIGPGSLFSSVMPNLLVDGVAQALRETRALKVLIANLMTQPGETDGMDAVEHVRAVVEHVGPVVDVALVNARRADAEVIERYRKKGQLPVEVDRRGLIEAGVIPVEADLLKEGRRIRHDSRKVARCLLQLARNGL